MLICHLEQPHDKITSPCHLERPQAGEIYSWDQARLLRFLTFVRNDNRTKSFNLQPKPLQPSA